MTREEWWQDPTEERAKPAKKRRVPSSPLNRERVWWQKRTFPFGARDIIAVVLLMVYVAVTYISLMSSPITLLVLFPTIVVLLDYLKLRKEKRGK